VAFPSELLLSKVKVGKIITIKGIEKSGKTTQAQMLGIMQRSAANRYGISDVINFHLSNRYVVIMNRCYPIEIDSNVKDKISAIVLDNEKRT
jgi:hypothetical protein